MNTTNQKLLYILHIFEIMKEYFYCAINHERIERDITLTLHFGRLLHFHSPAVITLKLKSSAIKSV